MASRTCTFVIICHLIYMISAQEAIKRVPQGFVGMRGKKYTDLDSAEVEHFFKRKPQFFVGVKGKKSFLNPLEHDALSYKRTPMGFVGMRGKKELTEDNVYYPEGYTYLPKRSSSLIGQIDYTTNDDMKNTDTPVMNELLNEYLQKLEDVNSVELDNKVIPQTIEEASVERITNEVDKRAANIPSYEFLGIRGKTTVHNKRPYDLTFRGKFIGVRGKKDAKNSGMQELKFLLDQSAPWPKRKTQMGFFGMRGKKWTDEAASPAADATN